jgi:hypothetical protein
MPTTYKPNIPQPNDNLSVSQNDILGNFQQLDTSFGIDHYKYSDATTNNGFHNQATMPLIVGGTHPTTAAGITKIYAMQDNSPIGLINYSRGPSNATPTPLTSIHSAHVFVLASPATINIVDFTGLSLGLASLFIYPDAPISPPTLIVVYWTGAGFIFNNSIANSTQLVAVASGSMLQIQNNRAISQNLYWTLQLHRTQI